MRVSVNVVPAAVFAYQIPSFTVDVSTAGLTYAVAKLLEQRFSNCGPRTTSGPRVLPLWSF